MENFAETSRTNSPVSLNWKRKMSYEFYGTIKPQADFNAEAAADKLYEAMKGAGCDKYKVIQVIAHCNNAQRQMVS